VLYCVYQIVERNIWKCRTQITAVQTQSNLTYQTTEHFALQN